MAKVPGKTSKSAKPKTWRVTHKWPPYVHEGEKWEHRLTDVTAAQINMAGPGEATFMDEAGMFVAFVADVLMIEERKL